MTISKLRIGTAALALLGIAAAVAIAAWFVLSTPRYSARSMLLVAATPPQARLRHGPTGRRGGPPSSRCSRRRRRNCSRAPSCWARP